MSRQSRFETTTYRDSEIRVRVEQASVGAKWTLWVDVYVARGKRLPRISEQNVEYDNYQDAIAHGFRTGRALVENRYFGWMWRHIYSFHLRHHAVIDCNEGISGFFTFPVADLVFRTWVNPKTLYVDGGGWEPEDFHSPRPIAPIRWLDKWTDERVKARRARARE